MTAQDPAATDASEFNLVSLVAENYSQRGYDVTLEPAHADLPQWLARFRPDLIASRGADHIAVVIKSKSGPLSGQHVPDVNAIRANGWRAELFFADDPVPSIDMPTAVADRVREATELLGSHHAVAALLLIWAAAEEALRSLAARFAPSETAGKFISPDQAFSIGLLSSNQLNLFNSLRDFRNQAAHNVATPALPEGVITEIVSLLERMLRPAYLPPPIMADSVFAQFDPEEDVLEQVKALFPESGPPEQSDAADYLEPYQRRTSQIVTVTREDDLDGGSVDETIRFGIDGTEYEIDLSARHAAAIREDLAPFIARSRQVSQSQPRRPQQRRASSRQRSEDIRAWAKSLGISVSEHGRIPQHIVEQYEGAELPGSPT